MPGWEHNDTYKRLSELQKSVEFTLDAYGAYESALRGEKKSLIADRRSMVIERYETTLEILKEVQEMLKKEEIIQTDIEE